MKKNLQMILTTVSCIITLICLIQINGLKSKINDMNSSIAGQISAVNSTVNSLNSNIYYTMNESASLVADSGYDYKTFDSENGTVNVHIYATPKEYTPGKTTASAYIGEKEYPMTLENGSFVLDMDMPISDTWEVLKIVFTEGETVKNEMLDLYISPLYEAMPQVDAYFNGETYVNGRYKYKGTVDLNMMASANMPLPKITKTALIEKIDGKVIAENNINLKFDDTDEYYTHGSCNISREPEIPDGSTYQMLLKVEDENGFTYVMELETCNTGKNGNSTAIAESVAFAGATEIYDKKGNRLNKND